MITLLGWDTFCHQQQWYIYIPNYQGPTYLLKVSIENSLTWCLGCFVIVIVDLRGSQCAESGPLHLDRRRIPSHCVPSASANIWTNKIILVADILETGWHFQGLLQTTQLSATVTNTIRFVANLTGVSNLFLLKMQFINAAKCITTLHLTRISEFTFLVSAVINDFC